jgi:hypothetical protein
LEIKIFFKGIFVNTDGEISKIKIEISNKFQKSNYKFQIKFNHQIAITKTWDYPWCWFGLEFEYCALGFIWDLIFQI